MEGYQATSKDISHPTNSDYQLRGGVGRYGVRVKEEATVKKRVQPSRRVVKAAKKVTLH